MKHTFSLLAFMACLSLTSFPVGASETTEAFAPSDCVGTLSGAVQGTFRCVMIAAYGFTPGVGVISFTPAKMPAGVQSVTASFQIPGEPKPGHVSFEDCKDCMASLTETNGTLFLAQKKPPQGSASLEVTSAARLFPTPEGTLYTVHGAIEAELPQHKPSGVGVVRMRVEF